MIASRAYEASLASIKMEGQNWPEKLLASGRGGGGGGGLEPSMLLSVYAIWPPVTCENTLFST